MFGCKEYNPSDFSVGHLVMSMCRVFSCIVGRGCLLWPVRFLFFVFSFCPASFCIPRPNLPVHPSVSWLPSFEFQSPIMKRTSFWGVSYKRSCRSSIEPFSFSFFSITGWGIDLDYCDIGWFALEMNRDHFVVFEIASKYCISDSFVPSHIKPGEVTDLL